MRIIEAVNDCTLKIGKTGENDATVVVFNLQDWLTLFGNNGTFQLMFKRPTDEHAYPVVIAATGGVVNWTVDETALAYNGVGLCEVVYLVNNTIAKSQTWVCEIEESPSDNSEEPPAPWQGWVDDVLQAATDAENAAENADAAADRAEEAAVHAPQIGENGHWEVWNQERGEYVDTGVPARSSSIHNDLEERNAEDAHPAASVSYFKPYEEDNPSKKIEVKTGLRYTSEGYASEYPLYSTGWKRVWCGMRSLSGFLGLSLTYNNTASKGRVTQNLLLAVGAAAKYASDPFPEPPETPIANVGQPQICQVFNVLCGEDINDGRYSARVNIIDKVRFVGIPGTSDIKNKMVCFIDVHVVNKKYPNDDEHSLTYANGNPYVEIKLNWAGKAYNNSVEPIYSEINVNDLSVPYPFTNNHVEVTEVLEEQAAFDVDFEHQLYIPSFAPVKIDKLSLGSVPFADTDATPKKYVDDGLGGKIGNDEKGAAGGVAELDENGFVPASQIPIASNDAVGGIKVYGGYGIGVQNGLLLALLGSVEDFYSRYTGNAFVGKTTLLRLMGNPEVGTLIATLVNGRIPTANLGNVPSVEVPYHDAISDEDSTITISQIAQYLSNITADVIDNTEARHTHDNKDVLDGITAEKVEDWDNKQDKLVLRDAGTKSELKQALASSNYVTLTDNITFREVLTIPAGTTLNLNGYNLYVTGLVNNGTLTKNDGKLIAEVSKNDSSWTTPVSIANVSNIWVANEIMLDPNSELDGMRLIETMNTPATAGVKATVEANLPRLVASGAGVISTSNDSYYFLAQIPQGKIFDLYNKTIVFCATKNTMGLGDIVDTSKGQNGRISLYMDDSANRGTYTKAVAVANERPTQKIFRIQQASGTRNYNSRAAIPANSTFIVSGGTANNIVFMVDDVNGFTRQGTSDTKATNIGFKLANDITITPPFDLGTKRFDFNGHFVSGGKITTTGTISHTGGGGYRGIFELIEEITADGTENQIELSADTYGNAFNLSSVVIKISNIEENIDCRFYGASNDVNALVELSYTNGRNGVAMCEAKNNMLFASGGTTSTRTVSLNTNYDSIMAVESESIKRIVLFSPSEFPDGAKIQIYGAIR